MHSAVFASYVTQGRQEPDVRDHQSIVRGLAPAVWTAALKIPLPATWEREDLLQVGLLAALECTATFNPERGAFVPFALTAARRAMQDASVEGRGAFRIHHEAYRRQTEDAVAAHHADARSVHLDALTPEGSPVSDFIGDSRNFESAVELKEVFDRLPERVQAELMTSVAGTRTEGTQQARHQRLLRALTRATKEERPVVKTEGRKPRAKSVRKAAAQQSGVAGVYWHAGTGKWQARLVDAKGKHVYLGLFKEVDDAREALVAAKAQAAE